MHSLSRALFACGIFMGLVAVAVPAQEHRGPVQVIVKDGKTISPALELPFDPTPKINIGFGGGFRWGLMVDGKRITCSEQGSIWLQARIDGREFPVGDLGVDGPGAPKPLPPGLGGKKRQGNMVETRVGDLLFTQVLEMVPGRPIGKPAPGAKRRLDTCLCRYIVENKGPNETLVELRTGIDILIFNNDGALFAAPTLYPGKVLNGVMLEGKTLPDFVQVLERPDANNPGFFGVMTTKFGSRVEGPSRVALTNLSAFGAWEVNVAPAGDSAAAIYWAPKKLKPGEKREMVFAYGGGIASNPENEGKVSIGLSGSFEPGKAFLITAHVEDPTPSQSLRLELPEGMRTLEGREIQPVPDPGETGASIVMWKATVDRLGEYDIRIHSSNGVTQIKSLKIVPK